MVKDLNSGEPTGMFRERAQYLIKAQGPGVTPEELAERIALELDRCLAARRHGHPRHHHQPRRGAGVPDPGPPGPPAGARVRWSSRVIESNFQKESLLDLGFVQGFGSDWLRIGGIKMSIDGGFTGKNAAFREPTR